MSETLWRLVAERLDEHGHLRGVQRSAQRVRATGEVFTPTGLVIELLRSVDLDVFAPGRTVLDPACGDGQFLVAAKWIKILHHAMDEPQALRDLYGVDLMRDNVDICRRRLGGGTVVMGDALAPSRRLAGQSDAEHRAMRALFGDATTPKPRRRRRASVGRHASP